MFLAWATGDQLHGESVRMLISHWMGVGMIEQLSVIMSDGVPTDASTSGVGHQLASAMDVCTLQAIHTLFPEFHIGHCGGMIAAAWGAGEKSGDWFDAVLAQQLQCSWLGGGNIGRVLYSTLQ